MPSCDMGESSLIPSTKRFPHYPHTKKTLPERFFEKIVIGKDCWFWIGCRNNRGYGVISIGGRPHLASRLSWEIHRGKIPKNICVLHKCDVPCCVNPNHLFLGTPMENSKDMLNKGRFPCGEEHWGAKLTAKAVKLIKVDRQSGLSYSKIAARYGVSYETIRDVCIGATWSHVH